VAPSPPEEVRPSVQALTPAFVQVAAATPQQSQATVAVTLPQAQQAGDLNAVAVGWNDTTQTISSVTDANGNVYQLAAPIVRGTGLSQAIYYAANIKGGSNTVTVTFSGAAVFVDLRVAEYTGLAGTVDAKASGAGSAATATSGSFTTTTADLVFAAGTTSGSFSGAGTGYTLRTITTPDADIVEDGVISAPGSYTATAPQSGDWVMQAVAFKAASSTGDAGAPDTGTDAADASDTGADASDGAAPACSLPTVPNPPPPAFTYPLKASANKRYLVDQNGKPFLLMGDAPQCLSANGSVSDAVTYFQERAAQGFNAAWVNLLCDSYTGGPANGVTFDGIHPFTSPSGATDASTYDLSTPNEAYFCRIDQLLSAAAQYNVVVFLDPIETGGWLQLLRNQGVAKATGYGAYLGNRYKNVPNIVWMHGNDFQSYTDPNDNALVLAVGQGILGQDPHHLQTAELAFNVSSSLDAVSVSSGWSQVLGLNATYTYFPTYAQLYVDYNRTSFLPNFLVESNYEGEQLAGAPHVTNAHDVRTQYYWTVTSGATGSLYGNHFIWPWDPAWQSHLTDLGAAQATYVQSFFGPRAWYNLVPDQGHTVVTAGIGTCDFNDSANAQDDVCATTARTPDGTLVVTYMPTARAVTVDMTKLSGPATARFYDPTTGLYTVVTGSPIANTGTHVFTPPSGTHGETCPPEVTSCTDWVLVLEASPNTTPPTTPTNLSATAASSSAIDLAWTASTSAVGIADYEVLRCQGAGCTPTTPIGGTTTTSFVDTGLSPSTTYVYAIVAVDTLSNQSAASASASATTDGLPDGGGGDTAAFVQIAAAVPQSPTQTVPVAYGAPQVAGHFNVVAVGWNQPTGTITSVKDSNGNAYQLAVGILRSASMSQAIYFAPNVKAGANTVTVVFSGAVAFPDIRVAEYSGLSAAAVVVQTAGATGVSSLASAGTVSTTGSGQLVFAAGMTTGGFGGATGSGNTRIVTSPDADIVLDILPAAAGSFTASASVNDQEWLLQAASFQ
jgi:hypothetical protein